MYPLLMAKIRQPSGTIVDCLVAEFSEKDDISYLYVTHDLQPRYVSHKKENNYNPIVEHEESQYISVHKDIIYQLGSKLSNFVMTKLFWLNLHSVVMKIFVWLECFHNT